MTITNNQLGTRFRQTALASLTALYFGGMMSATAQVQMQPVGKGNFYQPSFTKEQVLAADKARKASLEGDIYAGQPGVLNQVLRQRTPEQIFQPDPSVSGVQSYIVQLNEEPLATYDGSISGLAATKAPKNRSLIAKGRVSVNTTDARAYSRFLEKRQDSFVNRARQAGANLQLKQRFTIASNAMVVEMTQEDAKILARQSGVKRITPNRIFQLRTDRGPEFIGADRIWLGQDPSTGLAAKGEGMLVGIIDTGVNTDHPAFAEDQDYVRLNPLGSNKFAGDCVNSPELCNNKLVGVHSYPEITDVYGAPEFQANPWGTPVMLRPANGEDYNGHGSHTASTVAGNHLVNTPLQAATGDATSDGVNVPFNFPATSGVAPRAHIISYQVCWPGNGGDPYAGCPESAILAAFEDAIADGVDAINFSIGGAESLPWADPMELAFLAAREAGISVAVAAGNAGAYWSADHSSPWVTTVGATTHDRVLEAGNKHIDNFGGNERYRPSEPIVGKSFSGGITGEVVLAENYADPDPSDDFNAASCNVPFPAGTFRDDQIVICERGDIPRVDKAKNVAAGGAGGFILQNVDYQVDNLVADSFVIPGIQVKQSNRYKLKNWVKYSEPGTAVATISDFSNEYLFDDALANNLAPFSSMGPSRTNNTLVPDLTAPGVQIYAANADDQPFTGAPDASDWTFMSGTSMAAPHVTGAMTLLMQLHPEWTPAEVQSALMMTAGPVYLNTGYELLEPFYHFMAGAGAINVARAADTGLVMDETIENYRNANPENGGIVNWLNLPSMVEMACEQSCSWMRTVTATRDGSWSAEALGKEQGFELSVSPTNFTLAKGESQTLVIKAKVPPLIESNVNPSEPGTPWQQVQNKNTFFNGELRLTEASGASPELHMPVVVASKADQMPVSMELEISRAQGSETLKMNTSAYAQLTPRFYGPVQPELKTATLEAVAPFLDLDYIEKGWDIQTVTVPEGAKRLVVEVQSAKRTSTLEDMNPRYSGVFPFVILGRDANGNNGFIPSQEEMEQDDRALKAEYDAELVCFSSSQAEHNLCSLENPAPGTYWFATAMAYGKGEVEAVTGHAVIMADDDRGMLSLDGPASHDGNGDYQLTLNWNIPDAKQGDVFYGGMDLGAGLGAEGSFGFSALNIRRGEDAVSWSVSQDKALSEDVVDVTVKLAANLESRDRNYELQLKLPEGMRLAPATIKSNNPAVAEAIVADESGLMLTGLQPSTRLVERQYKVSTNLNDAMCRTPMIDEYSTGGYIDLFGEFGMQPNADWLAGDSQASVDVPIDWLFYKEGAEFKVYNQANAGYMRMHTVGALQFNTAYWYMGAHRGPGFLYEALAPFWRGSFEMKYRRHWEEPWGLTIATQYKEDRPDLGDLLFLEFDNVTDRQTGQEFDFQTILRSGIDDHPGMYEIIYAYQNLGADVADGAVFVEGFDSTWSSGAGPKNGYLYEMLGFDNLDTLLKDDLVICFDYTGPEQSRVELSFKAAVQPGATGKALAITLNYDLEGGEPGTLSHQIAVKGNIQLAPLSDMSVTENGRIDGIAVTYVDADKVPNLLEVSGEHISAEIDGDSFNLIPEADFHGETLVTVTVRDSLNSGDAASTSFMLKVESDGVDPVSPPEPPLEESDSGGSLGWSLLALLSLGLLRRKR